MFSTKAQTLLKLQKECGGLNILPLHIVTSSGKAALEAVGGVLAFAAECGCDELIVRSSCRAEDTAVASNAGKFTSILHVKSEADSVRKALDDVYASYGGDADGEEEILVQPMLNDIARSGVIFTRDVYSGAPYYVIDYFDGDDSAAVTSGMNNGDKVRVVFRNIPDGGFSGASSASMDADGMHNLLAAVKRIEEFFAADGLDIEFAITKDGKVYIFQVRPLAVAPKSCLTADQLDFPLRGIIKKAEKLMRPRPFIAGRTTCFGVMPDWNPAEMLGSRPKKLAVSLYKELITDNIWAHQREIYGYRNLTQNPLMVLFCGIPYIDTRITFNSFVPSALPDRLAEKLVNYYLARLVENPALHDKIEFEIVFSCYYLGLADKLKSLLAYGFNENELKRLEYALLKLTNDAIDPDKGLYKQDIAKIELLRAHHQKILAGDLSTVDKIYWLIEECKANGTLPFAGVARAAFIAVEFLKSLVKRGILSQAEYDGFMGSLNTISRQMGTDRRMLDDGRLTKEGFLAKYGHIRPGTYDVESLRYDEAYDIYFAADDETGRPPADVPTSVSFESNDVIPPEKLSVIDRELEENGLCVNAVGLFKFAKEAIEGREYLKFVFTKTVSEILRQIEIYGRRLGIPRSELAHLDISEVQKLYSDLYSGDIAEIFAQNIAQNKKQYEIATQIKLPPLIVSPQDVYSFELPDDEPNFITNKCVAASVVKEDDVSRTNLAGKIICIKAADPGYDYLFTKNIGGLITQFGGANSHMAIRCAELSIPAVIGSGEKNYEVWSKQPSLLLDAGKRQVKCL